MSDRDRFVDASYTLLNKQELAETEKQFWLEYLLRYLKGRPVEDYDLKDVLDWNFTGDNIIFTSEQLEIPVDQLMTNYTVNISGTITDIYSVVIDGNYLYIGGNFTVINGVSSNAAIRYDMTTGVCSAMTGLGGTCAVLDLDVDSTGIVYAVGFFQIDGTYHRFASWNGSAWTGLGTYTTLNDYVYSVKVDASNNVYVGGVFLNCGDANGDGIVLWNSSSQTFSSLGTGVIGYVTAIDIDSSGNVYAGGLVYTFAGDDSMNNIAKWNGSSWSAMGDGLGVGYVDTVQQIRIASDGTLYACGDFTTNPGGRIAKWNGSSWEKVGGGLSDYAWDMAFDTDDNLYVVGEFIYAGGKKVYRLAKWDGAAWQNLGASYTTRRRAVTVDSYGVLYVGGL